MSETDDRARVTRAVLPGSLLAFFVSAAPVLGATIYIDINATCGGAGQPTCDGLTWCTGFKALPDAQGGDVLFVADGTYHPGGGFASSRRWKNVGNDKS